MKSPFELENQNSRLESKIVVALERVSEAIRVLLWDEAKSSFLSPIQLQLLIFLLFHSPDKCKVSYLAREFNMTKATVSDSIKGLLQKGMIEKTIDPGDSRSQIITLTPNGQETAKRASLFANKLEKPLSELTTSQKAHMLNGLLKLIYELNQSGVITMQRMCFSCNNYRFEGGVHYCKLLETKLNTDELRVDCPEHEMVGT